VIDAAIRREYSVVLSVVCVIGGYWHNGAVLRILVALDPSVGVAAAA
jgi:hypothetical protein